MPPQFPDFRRIRRRVKRSLNYGLKKNASLNLPLQDMVVNYFDRHSPYDYMKPEISANISHRGFADPCSFVIALIYLERMRNIDKDFFESSEPADLYLPALVLASKYLHDSDTWDRATNSEWAEAADITPEHLNSLEWDFVKRLNWNIIVRDDEFDNVLKTVECYAANYNVEQNGVATYNELFQLASNIPGSSYIGILQDLFSFIGLMGIVYTITLFSVLAIPSHMESTECTNASASVYTPGPSSAPIISVSHKVPDFVPNRIPNRLPMEVLRRVAPSSPSDVVNSVLPRPVIALSSYNSPSLSPVLEFNPALEFDSSCDYGVPLFEKAFKFHNQLNLTEVCA